MSKIFKKFQDLINPKPKAQKRKFILISLFSGLFGAGAALFSSKNNGQENRKLLVDGAENLSKNGIETGSKLSKELTEKTNSIKESITKQISELTDKIKTEFSKRSGGSEKANQNDKKVEEIIFEPIKEEIEESDKKVGEIIEKKTK